jgi:hypothetical protein
MDEPETLAISVPNTVKSPVTVDDPLIIGLSKIILYLDYSSINMGEYQYYTIDDTLHLLFGYKSCIEGKAVSASSKVG